MSTRQLIMLGGQVPYDEVCNILTSASDQGVNFLDTSRLYGASESVLGKTIAESTYRFLCVQCLTVHSNYFPTEKHPTKACGAIALKTWSNVSCEGIPLGSLRNRLNHLRFHLPKVSISLNPSPPHSRQQTPITRISISLCSRV